MYVFSPLLQPDKWHFGELGHLYLSDMLVWSVHSGLQQLCIRSLTGIDPPETVPSFPVHALPPSLLEPDVPETTGGESKYKMCATYAEMDRYVVQEDPAWDFGADGGFDRNGFTRMILTGVHASV